MDPENAINIMLGIKTKNPNINRTKKTLKSNKINNGVFESSYHHQIKPKRIDDETWWYPNKSGIINKGYWKGYYYNDKRKEVIDLENKKIIHKR